MPYDFNRLKYEIRPGDVITGRRPQPRQHHHSHPHQSPWTHACFIYWRLIDFEDDEIRKHPPDTYRSNG